MMMITVPQTENSCRTHAVLTITASETALSIREIRTRMSRFQPYLQREVLAALEGLTAEGLVDFEQPLTEVKFYFLPRARHGATSDRFPSQKPSCRPRAAAPG